MIKIKSVEYIDFKMSDDKPLVGFYYWQAWGQFDFVFEDGKEYSIKTSDVAGGCGPITLYNYPYIYSDDVQYIKVMVLHIIDLIVSFEKPCTDGANFITITQGGLTHEDENLQQNVKMFRKMLKSLGFKENIAGHWRHTYKCELHEEDFFQIFFVLDLSPYYLKSMSTEFRDKYKQKLKEFKKLN